MNRNQSTVRQKPRWLLCFIFLLGFPSNNFLYSQSGAEPKAEFQNPLLWEDLADVDVLRVGNAYYYSASNMHYSPGAPLLRSYDLVHWEYVGHSLPRLDFGPQYDMKGGTAYVRGSWASFLGYRNSNRTFYWGGCIDFNKTYIYTASDAEGPWRRNAVIDRCYYDPGLLIDDNDKMYVAYGNTTLHVAELSQDGTQEVQEQKVFESPSDIGTLEGSRFYKINGSYYIFATHPPNGEYVLRSTAGPFGPYTAKKLVLQAKSPVPGGGSPHQGGVVQTHAGSWYYLAFTDVYPGGRIPVLAPLRWNKEGWPEVELNKNQWKLSYPLPVQKLTKTTTPQTDLLDTFTQKTLSPEWEWNHNPDDSKWSTGKGLILRTATVTDSLYLARNTLTHRIPGPVSMATVLLDCAQMKSGDVAGLAMLRDHSATIEVKKEGGSLKIQRKNNIDMARDWKTYSRGEIGQSAELKDAKVWLRVEADIRPGAGRKAIFSYSTDGLKFQPMGNPFELNPEWPFFMGYRFAIFNYAAESLGGNVTIPSFQIVTKAESL